MAVGQHLRLRAFIEGIEIPIVSASVSIQPDAPSQCQIQIPATDKAHEFLPRSLVHVFYVDFYDGPTEGDDGARVGDAEQASEAGEVADEENRRLEGVTDGVRDDPAGVEQDGLTQSASGGSSWLDDDAISEETTGLDLDRSRHNAGPTSTPEIRGEGTDDDEDEEPDIADSRWKLLFCGEIMGYQFMKSHAQRSVVLNCMDLSIYWDTCYQYQVNVASLHGNATAQFVGAGTTLFDTFFQSSTSSIVDVVRQRSRARPELTGLLSGVVHLLERVGGVYNRQGFRGVNDFFTMAELRYHLIDMIGASEDDDSSQRLFPRRAFNRWSRGSAGRLGKIASFREILNLLNGFIYHNTVPCPVAHYQPAEQQTRERSRTIRWGETEERFSDTDAWRDLNDRIDTQWRTFNSYVSTSSSPSRTIVSDRLDSLASQVQQTKDRVQRYSARYGLSSVTNDLHNAGREIRALARIVERYERLPDSFSDWASSQGNSDRIQRVRDRFSSAIRSMDDGSSTRPAGSRTVNTTESRTISARLYSQIIRPDIFMCPPPRCNILFPELYSQIQFSRQYMREVSRMRLTVSDEIFGSDALLNSVYFAPDVEVLGARVRQGRSSSLEGATLSRAAYARRLMEHELYTGPIPVFERMNEVNIAAARGQPTSHRGARVPYAMRAANFQFFKNRWSSRTMSASGKFNPWAVCGFPMLVIDRYMTEDNLILSGLRGQRFLEEAWERDYPGIVAQDGEEYTYDSEWGALDAWDILRNTVPTQFIGLVMGLQHNINQSSASTSYTFAAARTHRDNDELLGANRIRVSADPPQRTYSRTNYTSTRSGSSFRDQIQAHLNTLSRYSQSNQPMQCNGLSDQVRTLAGQIRNTKEQIRNDAQRYNIQSVTNDLHLAGRAVLLLANDLQRYEETGVSSMRESTTSGIRVGFVESEERRSYRQFFSQSTNQSNVTEARNRLNAALSSVGGASRTVAHVVDTGEDTEPDAVDVPLEVLLRPPWMSSVWANDRIGDVYQQFFGTGALTDPIVIDTGYSSTTDTADAAAVDAANEEGETTNNNPARGAGGSGVGRGADGNFGTDRDGDENTQEPIRADGRAVQEAEMGITVQRAVDLLVRSYSAVKLQGGMDVTDFVRAYTWRPVATLTDMLGSRDLEIDPDTGEVSGIEGFHSRSFGHEENGRNLRNLLPPDSEGRPIRRILGISTESSTRLEGGREADVSDEDRQRSNDALVRLDTRADKAEKVLDYVTDLWESRGQLG